MGIKFGDKIIVTNPDETSRICQAKIGDVGKVIWVRSDQLVRACNPKWAGGWIPLKKDEYELIKEGRMNE